MFSVVFKQRFFVSRVFQLAQVELWQGSWDIPNVPDVDRLSPYVKANALTSLFDESRSPSPVVSSTFVPQSPTEIPSTPTTSGHSGLHPVTESPRVNIIDVIVTVLYVKSYCFFSNDQNEKPITILCRLNMAGLQNKFPENHPLLQLYRSILAMSHPNQDEAVANYVSTASRTFRYIEDWVKKEKVPYNHWVDLFTQPNAVLEYLSK